MNLLRIRWAVRGVLVLGVAASVVANVLHAVDNPISQSIAAWPPLALLLTVELISRIPVHSRWLAVARVIATAVIAGIAAWVSYWHMVGVSARYGETGASPYLLPVSVDGLIVVASICLVELAGRIRTAETTTVVTTVVVDPAEGVSQIDPPAVATADAKGVETVNAPALATDEGSPDDISSTEVIVDPWQHAVPVKGVRPMDTPEPVKPSRVKPRSLTAAERVIAAHTKQPAATHDRIAQVAKVSVSTVKRHRPTGSPSASAPAPTRINGAVPDLEDVKL